MATNKPKRPSRGEAQELGIDEEDIPGGLNHLANAETHPVKPEVPAHRYIKDLNAHGVPVPNPDVPNAAPEAGKVLEFPPVELPDADEAIPVYIVEEPGKQNTRREAIAEQITVPVSGSDPVRLCSIDRQRVQVSLLNNDANNDVQFSENISTVVEGRGAVLPHAASSYRTLRTQGELWALSTAAAEVKVSVILETEVNV